MLMMTNVLNWQELFTLGGHILFNVDNPLKLGVVAFMFFILIYGIFIGPKGKARDTKHYDAREKNNLQHHFRVAEGGKDYAYKGSGMYRNSNGEVKKDK